MHRDYRGVAGLVSAVGTDSKFENDEMQIFKSLGRALATKCPELKVLN